MTTAKGMLDYLTAVNAHGVWFIRVGDKWSVVPRWMWGYLKRLLPDKEPMK